MRFLTIYISPKEMKMVNYLAFTNTNTNAKNAIKRIQQVILMILNRQMLAKIAVLKTFLETILYFASNVA
jgi:hypothetical protein